MATITDIKSRIRQMAPAPFQEFCDTLLHKKGYGIVHGYGMMAGSGKTTIGNPDTYFRKENGKYVFVAYTTQVESIYSKLKDDIDKCLDCQKTGLEITEIEEIICCHTSSNLSAGDDKKLHNYCESKGVSLVIWGIDEIANQVYHYAPFMAKEFLGLSIDTNQIMSIDEFVKVYDANKLSAPINTIFQYREDEKTSIIEALKTDSVVILTGKAGVGKTRLSLEIVREYANIEGYSLLCVKNNNKSLYNDLISRLEKHGKYLFFVDDANELASLEEILEHLTREQNGYLVKILITVRDYVKEILIDRIKKYADPKVVKVFPFSDNEIKEFLKENLGIKNEDYIRQIVRIAEGNPRHAYMSGKIAKEKKDLSAICDVSELYDNYYARYVHSTIGENKKLCFSAGVLAIVNTVILNNLTKLHKVLDFYGISTEEFRDMIISLSKLEVVELQLNQIASFSDQCLANYMLYYVFIEEKMIPFSSVVEIGYLNFRKRLLETINTVFNLFQSKDTTEYCRQEILKVWNRLKDEKSPLYRDFVIDFHYFRPEEGFLLAQMEIEGTSQEGFKANEVDFSQNVYDQNESILRLLAGYNNSDDLQCVLELLLKYASKTSQTMISAYKWLENNYGIRIFTLRYGFFVQEKIILYLADEIKNNNSIAMALGFQWVKYSLSLSFQFSEMDRNNMLEFHTFRIRNSEELRTYREKCWAVLSLLATKEEWQEEILLFLDFYSKSLTSEIDRDIFVSDKESIEQLLTILKRKQIGFLVVVSRILSNGNKIGIIYSRHWREVLCGKEWELYQLLKENLELDYEEDEIARNTRLSEYGKKLKSSDIKGFVQAADGISSDRVFRTELWDISNSIEVIIEQLDKLCLDTFLKVFIQCGKHISISASRILRHLNLIMDSTELLNILKVSDFPQKNEWMFSFFETLPDIFIDSKMLEEFLCFLRDDSDKKIRTSTWKSLRVLDKFLVIEENIYPIASSLILNKRKYSIFMVRMYLKGLFNVQIYSAKELIRLYQDDISLLQELYFFMLEHDDSHDFRGNYLTDFLPLDASWIKRYTELLWSRKSIHNDYGYERNASLWKSKDFMKYFDYIFYHSPKREEYGWGIEYVFKGLLECSEAEIVKTNQQEWITHIIIENAFTERIDYIFDFISYLDDDTNWRAIKIFLDYNSDCEWFKKLSLEPGFWSGIESFVPAYRKQIDFLESLYPLVGGMKYLKHKQYIRSKVEFLEERIKEEEIQAIYRHLY